MHYCAEGPVPQNVYNGVATLDAGGRAWVDLPACFESLNIDYRYLLTSIGAPARLYVASEIKDNRFQIAGGKPGMKVSWEVKAQRNDVFVRQNGAPVEIEKTGPDRGRYLTPEPFGMPAEMGMHHVMPHAVGTRPICTDNADSALTP